MGNSTLDIPLYLQKPKQNGDTNGILIYDKEKNSYQILGPPPHVREFAKRIFPGCNRREDYLEFKATVRAVGDLNWFLLRFPLKIECENRFDKDRQDSIEHALRRESNEVLDLEEMPATFIGTLKEFQKKGVAYLLANRNPLLADEMGLGKTVEALAALAAANAFPAIVVTPPPVTRQWARMAETFLDLKCETDLCHVIKGLQPYRLPQVPITIIHYGLLRGWKNELPDLGFKAVVFDEIQELRHIKTQKYSAASLLSGATKYAWGLSGSPVYNYGNEIWAVMNILEFNCLGDQESFTREWCDGYGGKIVLQPKVLGDYLRREGLMLRRRKEDVQTELPAKRRVVTVIDQNEDQYQKMIVEAVKLAKGYDNIKDWTEKGQAARDMDRIARQASGIAKAPYAAAFVKSLLDAGEKVLVYSHHKAVRAIIADILYDYDPVQISGLETQEQKEHAVAQFSTGKTNLCQISLRAAAGIDGLQKRGTCVVFAELDWSPAIHSQCEDRLHRMGVKTGESILCYYLVSNSGYDEVMQEALGLKIGQFVGIMGDKELTEKDKDLAGAAARKHLHKIIDVLRGKKETPMLKYNPRPVFRG